MKLRRGAAQDLRHVKEAFAKYDSEVVDLTESTLRMTKGEMDRAIARVKSAMKGCDKSRLVNDHRSWSNIRI